MKRVLPIWLGAAVILTLSFGTTYVAVQQAWRQSADLPLIPLAEDAARNIDLGVKPAGVIGSTVDLTTQHDSFISVYDASGNLLASSGQLAGTNPTLPRSVATSVTPTKQLRFTWQPSAGHRFATVVQATTHNGQISGYVAAAGSLENVEDQEDHLTELVGLGWGLALLTLTATTLAVWPRVSDRRAK